MIAATTNYKDKLAAFGSGQIMLRVEITGYSRIFTNHDDGINHNWLVDVADFGNTINDLDGGADQVSTTFTVQDVDGSITGDFPGFVFEGALVKIKTGFPGMASGDYTTIFTGYIDSVDSNNCNSEYVFNCSDISAKLSKVIYLTGDDNAPTSSSHVLTLNDHPLNLLLDILNNQVGLDSSFVDITTIEAYRDGPFAGVQFLFHVTQAPAAADFIKAQLLKPLGGYLWVNAAGQITVRFFYPLIAPVALVTMGPGTWMDIPTAQQIDMVNTVQFQFDKDDENGGSGNYNSTDTELYGPSVARYGQYGELVIPADGVRSAFQGFLIARMTARMIFLRYGLKNLVFDSNSSPGTWPLILYETGDIVAVTHAQIPDRAAGVMGITAKLFEILDKKISPMNGTVTFKMIDASYLSSFGFFLVAPDGEADYTVASVHDKAKYMFQTGDDSKYSNGDAGHSLG